MAEKKRDDLILLVIALAGAAGIYWFWSKQASANPLLPGGIPTTPGTGTPTTPGTGTPTTPGTGTPTGTTPGTGTPTGGRQWALARAMIDNLASVQQQFGPKGAKGREKQGGVKAFQAGEGLKPDGLAGPATMLRAATYIPRLAFVQWWPKTANQATVAKYKAELERMAQAQTNPTVANELRQSAQRERGQAGVG